MATFSDRVKKNKRTCLIDEFQGTQNEFNKLINCKELSIFEWKDRLLRWDKKRKQKQKQQIKNKIKDKKNFEKRSQLIVSVIGIIFIGFIIYRIKKSYNSY